MRKTLILFLLLFTALLVSCKPKKIVLSSMEYYEYFDTVISLRVWDTKKYNDDAKLWKDAEKLIQDIQNTFQRNKDEFREPELYKLNQSAGSGVPFKISDDLFAVLKMAMEFADLTDGKFDPTIGPLVDLWDINEKSKLGSDEADPTGYPPTEEEIEALLPLVDYTLVEIDEENQTVLLPLEGMIIDLGAISKGYAADLLAEYFIQKGIKHAIIDLGGNIYALGKRYEKRKDGNDNWSIGIRYPSKFNSDAIAGVYLADKTIVTSGTYERYFLDANDNSKLYHHILDPDTGYPYVNDLLSVTIISDSSALADALSTSLFALGIQESIVFLETYFPDIDAVFIDHNLNFYKTQDVDSLYSFESYIN